MQTNSRLFRRIAMAMLGTIGFLLMLLDFPLPGFPPFLKMDLSEIPVLLGALVFGSVGGLVIEVLKNFLHYATQGSPAVVPVGELANVISGMLFVLPVAMIARKIHSRKGLTLGLIIGIGLMSLVMTVLNYFVLLPLYIWFLNFEPMSDSTMVKMVLIGVLPFNLIKGVLSGTLFVLLYPKLKQLIRRLNPGDRLNAV